MSYTKVLYRIHSLVADPQALLARPSTAGENCAETPSNLVNPTYTQQKPLKTWY